jgi:phage major head subunit gpT-like protein
VIINQANLHDLFRGFKASFNTGFRSATPQWDRIATLINSTTKEEKYAWLGQFPRLREWVGDRVVKDLESHDYAIKNRKFEATVGVPRDDIEDDTYGIYNPLMQEMGYAGATHPDELNYALLAAGFDTPCYDGQYFFDADHPVADKSVSNVQTGSGDPWFLLDTSRPLKPLIFQKRRDYDFRSQNRLDDDAVFMSDQFKYGVDARVNAGFAFWQQAYGSKATVGQDNFDAAVAAMMAFKSDEGRPLGIRPNLLVCGPSNRAAARKVIAVPTLDGGAANPNYQATDLLVVPWLA